MTPQPENLPLPNVEINDSFLSADKATAYFQKLLKEITFKSEVYTFSGATVESKRKVSYHSAFAYSYSNQSYQGKEWTDTLLEIKEQVEKATGQEFNAVLCNYYPDGSAGMGWHSDKERELGGDPVIASLSFGEKRRFAFRLRPDVAGVKNPKKICEYTLGHGTLLVMKEGTQPKFEHSLIKDLSATGQRMNLTFRKVIRP